MTSRRYLLLMAAALAELAVLPLFLLAVLLNFGLGMIFLLAPSVLGVRRLAQAARRRTSQWSGVELAAPYHPEPTPPVPDYDGWYRMDRTLYKTPRMPAWNMRWKWLVNDVASWRDALWLVSDPFVTFALLIPPAVAIAYGISAPWWLHPWSAPLGLAVAVVSALTIPRAIDLHGRWTRVLLSATRRSQLEVRVRSLSRARVSAVDSQAAELRRIERDLHDGAQARLVAMGMTLGAAEELIDRDPQAAKVLLAKARDASATALAELRRLVRGIHPPVLAERGLADAVRALALDTPLDVTVTIDLPERLNQPVESAAYFAVAELLANATKHGGARNVTIDITRNGTALRITVTDDGSGGADPDKGSGLRGIERRIAAFDGVLAVSSPAGGPTMLVIDLPYAFGTQEDDKPSMPKWKVMVVVFCWATAWLPLFPQGIVAAVFKIIKVRGDDGELVRSWLLALYLPEAWQWPFIAMMIPLGLCLYILATVLPVWHSKKRWIGEATARQPWLRR
ncbi:Signal transduction histidine kinase [Sinosporangium album]|uniref:histidine kinase n=1 Tax=Sinosporangium album TaxID=504805 RepID=A0A1G8EQS7_9ACTN|nr:sensor histidine kinase [Sinosporangium album]SDH72177.1 Signal transduction histidine kinase [Sinosporangium album]